MSRREASPSSPLEARLREILLAPAEGRSVWPGLRDRIGGRTPRAIEREESRVRSIRWIAAAAAILLITLQLVWHLGQGPPGRIDPVEVEVESSFGRLLDDLLVPSESTTVDPSTVLTLLVDREDR